MTSHLPYLLFAFVFLVQTTLAKLEAKVTKTDFSLCPKVKNSESIDIIVYLI